LVASVGVGKLEVFNKIKVGVFFTGDELIEPGKSLQHGPLHQQKHHPWL
jgi:molybdopterin molybdotransferase